MSTGKEARLRRLIDPESGTSLMFAFSHGTSTPEVLSGTERPFDMISAVVSGGAQCVFVAPGLARVTTDALANHPSTGFVVKVTATASRASALHQEVMTSSIERAVCLGADGVVALLPFAPENEPDVIRIASEIGESCDRWGVPFIAEAEFPNAYFGDADYATEWGLPYLRRSARLCVELGADIIKSNWTGSAESFAEIVGCVPVPVVVAGGSRDSDEALLRKVLEARSVGAIGCSVGRNLFQHDDPASMARALVTILRQRSDPKEVLLANGLVVAS